MAAPQRVLGSELESVWEGERWWVGVGWRTESCRFVAGEQDGTGAWKCTKNAVAPSLEGMKEKAASLKAKVTGNEAEIEAEAAATLVQGLLQSANSLLADPTGEYADIAAAASASGCRWMWASSAWRVARGGDTDPDGWTYATDWPRFAVPREGGRKSQRNTDVTRRRRIVRSRLLVTMGPDPTPEPVASELGDDCSLLTAISDLAQTREAEKAAKKEHTHQVMGVVKALIKTHVLSRSVKDQPMDPTAWYRLSNTHSAELSQTMAQRPPVTDADAVILRDLVRAMRFANGAYGYAAEQMVTIGSNVKMHTARVRGGVDYKDGVDAEVNTASLCKLSGIPTSAIVYSRWDGNPHAPACFIAVAEPRPDPLYQGEPGWLVVGVRGTLNINDTLCDLDAAEVDFLGGKAHQGFATAADAICGELEEKVITACEHPRHAGYELVVTGHSLGGCTSEIVALKLRELGRQRNVPMLTKARCLAFAGGPAATPDIQQSEESKALTVCVVYGNDIVPRLGASSVCTLLDELTAHGALAIARRKLKGGSSGVSEAAISEGQPSTDHAFENFPAWVGLPDGGKCSQCGTKRWKPGDSKYCKFCFVCQNCCKKAPELNCRSSSTPKGQPATAAADEPEPAPEGTGETVAPTQLALGGRVIWIDPKFSYNEPASATPHMRWAEWDDLTKITASSKMIEHHLTTNYLGALELRLGQALGLADPADAMSELTRREYEAQKKKQERRESAQATLGAVGAIVGTALQNASGETASGSSSKPGIRR